MEHKHTAVHVDDEWITTCDCGWVSDSSRTWELAMVLWESHYFFEKKREEIHEDEVAHRRAEEIRARFRK